MRRQKIVDIIGAELKMFVPEAETILYGSEARGDARPDSDIDLLIILPDFKDNMEYIKKRSDISGRLFELSLDLSVDISPLILPRNVWNSRKSPFTINVNNEGIRI
ncbi:MAG: nucleotidyltransferase domain-containing protein [Muribaculaceae bacterium]|nr:nucleotidyltransferase domain-containing protein [Muribaculaceae bacterium]